MPSIKPRIALTLEPGRYALLKRLAALQGVSMASLVQELLEECYPVLERVLQALEAVQEANESAKAGLRAAADQAIEQLAPMGAEVEAQFDLFINKALEAKAVEEGNPRVVTRGSGTKRDTTTPPSSPKKNPSKPLIQRGSTK